MNLELKANGKVHNRFDIRVFDNKDGSETWCQAENIILDTAWDALCSAETYWYQSVRFGGGTGTLSASRTTLFTEIGSKAITANFEGLTAPSGDLHDISPKQEGQAGFITRKVSILPSEHIGATFTEVGLGGAYAVLLTHAMIEDSEGNPISIGPKTDTQQIDIYFTIYTTINLPNGAFLYYADGEIPPASLGYISGLYVRIFGGTTALNVGQTGNSNGMSFTLLKDKGITAALNRYTNYYSANIADQKGIGFSVFDVANKKVSTPRIRWESAEANGKIWGVIANRHSNSSAYRKTIFVWPFPNTQITGHQFISKAINTGDGVTTEFSLPWNDINVAKAKTWYVDGVATAATITENTTTSTKIQFASAPANNAPITGDWWVDYIPKDTDHIFDVTFTIQYGDANV